MVARTAKNIIAATRNAIFAGLDPTAARLVVNNRSSHSGELTERRNVNQLLRLTLPSGVVDISCATGRSAVNATYDPLQCGGGFSPILRRFQCKTGTLTANGRRKNEMLYGGGRSWHTTPTASIPFGGVSEPRMRSIQQPSAFERASESRRTCSVFSGHLPSDDAAHRGSARKRIEEKRPAVPSDRHRSSRNIPPVSSGMRSFFT